MEAEKKKVCYKGLIKKLVAGAGVLALLFGAVPACAKETASAVSGEAAQSSVLDPESVVLIVGKEKVPLKKAYFILKYQQSLMQDMLSGLYGVDWYKIEVGDNGRTFEDEMKDGVMNLLVRMSLTRQNQKELGISISKEENKAIEAAAEEFINSNSQEALDAMMADKELVKEILADYTLLSKMIRTVTKDTKATYGEAKTYSYIYGSFSGESRSLLESMAEEDETMIETFQSIRQSAVTDSDFSTAASKQGYGSAMHTYFVENDGDALAEFNKVMDGLKPGEVSEVTTIGNNQGLFLGCMEAEVDERSLEEAKQSLLKNYQVKDLVKQMDAWVKKAAPRVEDSVWALVNVSKPMSAYTTSGEEKSAVKGN